MTVTLVGELSAKDGATFEYLGMAPACESCKLRAVCHPATLHKHRTYRVVSVRKVHHACPADFFEGGMRVAEVEAMPAESTISASTAARSTAVTHTFEECGAICLFKKFCNTPAIPQGTDCKIVQVQGPVDCKVGRDLRFATLEPRRGKA